LRLICGTALLDTGTEKNGQIRISNALSGKTDPLVSTTNAHFGRQIRVFEQSKTEKKKNPD
jgi:hypothetical protein